MRHPLGFRPLTLTLGGYRIRLHLWHPGGSDAPHNHARPFVSLPLLGRFTETLWHVQAGDTHRATRVHPGSRTGERRYRTLGRAALTAVREIEHRPLRPYRRGIDAVHSIAPAGRGPHVTLVMQCRWVTPSTIWFRDAPHPAPTTSNGGITAGWVHVE